MFTKEHKMIDTCYYRSFASMCPHVNFELRSLSEAVAASFTFKGLLVGVRTQVLEKVAFEGSLANRTLERFHASMVAAQMFAESI